MKWFAGYEKPAFALFGRRSTLPIAGVGPDHVETGRLLVRRLIALGHQRIVNLGREHRRIPEPGLPERAILEEMREHGLPTGPYNLPDREDTPAGYHRLLDELFSGISRRGRASAGCRKTPPSRSSTSIMGCTAASSPSLRRMSGGKVIVPRLETGMVVMQQQNQELI